MHSGVSFEPYLKSFKKLLGKEIVFNESYLASEGYIAFQQAGTERAMTLVPDNGLFFEFIPYTSRNFDADGNLISDPEILTLAQAKAGTEYALLLSTCSGAWRYLIGDTLKFTNADSGEIILTGRTKQFLNLCGEHLSQDNMNRAIKMLQDEFNIQIPEFSVTGINSGTLFAHKWYLGADNPVNETLAAQKLDEYLCLLNDDYRVERSEAIREVTAEVLPVQVFYDFLKTTGKEGGAHKFPRVLKNDLLLNWSEYVKEYKLVLS